MGPATWLMGRGAALLRATPLARSVLLNRVQLGVLGLLYRKDTVTGPDMQLRIHSPPDEIAKKLILRGTYEPEVAAVLASLVQPGDVVADVGANIGCHTILLSRLVGPTGRVIAVEPDPGNVALLRENLVLNGCENVTVLPIALGAEPGTAPLWVCSYNRGFQGLRNVTGTRRSIDVEVRRATDVFAGQPLSLVKIDVEGAEADVLAGFDTRPGRILFEFSAPQLRAFGREPLDLIRDLVAEGYVLSRIDRAGLTAVEPDAMAALAERTRLDYNLLAARGAAPNVDER